MKSSLDSNPNVLKNRLPTKKGFLPSPSTGLQTIAINKVQPDLPAIMSSVNLHRPFSEDTPTTNSGGLTSGFSGATEGFEKSGKKKPGFQRKGVVLYQKSQLPKIPIESLPAGNSNSTNSSNNNNNNTNTNSNNNNATNISTTTQSSSISHVPSMQMLQHQPNQQQLLHSHQSVHSFQPHQQQQQSQPQQQQQQQQQQFQVGQSRPLRPVVGYVEKLITQIKSTQKLKPISSSISSTHASSSMGIGSNMSSGSSAAVAALIVAKDSTANDFLFSSLTGSLKVNKLQSPAINNVIASRNYRKVLVPVERSQSNTMGGNTTLAAGTSAIYADEEEFKEVVEDEEEPIKEDTQLVYSSESSTSPQKFVLTSSDASSSAKSHSQGQSGSGKSQSQSGSGKSQSGSGKSSNSSAVVPAAAAGTSRCISLLASIKKGELKEEQQLYAAAAASQTQPQQQSLQTSSPQLSNSLKKEFLSSKDDKLTQNITTTIPQKISISSNHSENTNDPVIVPSVRTRENSLSKPEKIVKWKQGDFIGSGSFGQVFTAMNCNTGEIFVVKKIMVHAQPRLDTAFLDEQEKEMRIMETLSHKHIIQYKGHERQSDCLCVFLEYMSEGNISKMLSKFGAFEEQTIQVYARQILYGLEYLHSKKIIHKDIKGDNILVGSDGIVKLADFGCAKQLELTLNSSKDMNKTLKGSVPWMSPEIVSQVKYDTSADIWSFGCTILEMATAKPPWHNYEFDNPYAAILKIGLSNEIPLIPEDKLSIDLISFIKDCLQRDASLRPTPTKLLLHPFLNQN